MGKIEQKIKEALKESRRAIMIATLPWVIIMLGAISYACYVSVESGFAGIILSFITILTSLGAMFLFVAWMYNIFGDIFG
jgi:cation transporter-like permease